MKRKDKEMKRNIILAAVVIAVICIIGAIGFDKVFAFLLLVSLGILVHRTIKKRPRKKAAIAVAVFFVLTGIAGMFNGKEVPDNILDYLGTEERVVYQTYDKDDFEEMYAGRSNDMNDRDLGGLPGIYIDDKGKVKSIRIDRKTKKSFHMDGLHIGDDSSQVMECIEKWSEKWNAMYGSTDNSVACKFQYNGKYIEVLIMLDGNEVYNITVDSISIEYYNLPYKK